MTLADFVPFEEKFQRGELQLELPRSGDKLIFAAFLGPLGFKANDLLSAKDQLRFAEIFQPTPLDDLGCILLVANGDFLLVIPEMILIQDDQLVCPIVDVLISGHREAISHGRNPHEANIDLGARLNSMQQRGEIVILPGDSSEGSLFRSAMRSYTMMMGMTAGNLYHFPM